MTVPEYMADATERAAAYLAHFVSTTAADRQDWTPDVPGATGLRSALDMVSECTHVNRMIAGVLKGDPPPAVGPIDAPRPFSTAEEGLAMLAESAEALAEVVRAMTDADLSREFVTRRGPMPGAAVIELPIRNMHYHSGQVNLLQLLYGDAEFHVPAPKPQS